MEDYFDAASRHFTDANILHGYTPPRLANASHLYGFAGECVLKCILFGGKKGKVPQFHMPKIIKEFENHSALKGNPRLVKKVKACCLGLTDWSVDERYQHQGALTFAAGRVASQANSARQLLGLLSLWKKGVI